MSTEQARYRWPRGIGGRNPALILVVAMAAIVGASCADSPLELAPAEALAQVQADGHTWRAGASPTWHGYHAPAVTHEYDGSVVTVCTEWADDYLFTRDGGRYAGIDFFSFDLGWSVADGGWQRASVRNEAGTRRGCVAVEADEDDSIELTVKGMARDGSRRPTSTHHTVSWYGSLAVTAGSEEPEEPAPPADPLEGTTVLYFTDYVVGTDHIRGGLQALADAGLIGLVVASSRSNMMDRLLDQPDVVVHFNQDAEPSSAQWGPLVNWVQDGNRLILADWQRNATILGALEATGGSGAWNGDALVISDDRLAEGVQQPMPLLNPGWGGYSFGIGAAGDGVSACTFNNGSSCMVLGNEGRTVALGFLADVVTEGDAHNLIENLLRVVTDS